MVAQDQHLDLTLTGAVVGVGLRIWTRELAGRLGVTGWIRNNVDRTVSIHVEGPSEAVDGFIEQLRRPPMESVRIDDVQVRDAEDHGFADFSIEY